jgi:hypothetical protein
VVTDLNAQGDSTAAVTIVSEFQSRATLSMLIRDANSAALAVTFGNSELVPGQSTSIRFSRNDDRSKALTIALDGAGVTAFGLPATIVIPSGSSFVDRQVVAPNVSESLIYGLQTSADWYSGAVTSVQVTVTISDYSVWITPYTNLSDTTPQGDPDHDGIPNLLEFVLNGNPGASSTEILPTLIKDSGNFVFTFRRREVSVKDTTQIFQYSTGVNNWTNVNITGAKGDQVTIGATDGNGVQTVTVTIPKGINSKMFGRLQVFQP